MHDLSSQLGVEHTPSAVEAQSLNHRTVKEVPATCHFCCSQLLPEWVALSLGLLTWTGPASPGETGESILAKEYIGWFLHTGSDGWGIRREQGEGSLRYFLPPLTTPGSLLGVTTLAGTSSIVTVTGQLGRSCTCWPFNLAGGWSWLYGHRLWKTL